MGGPPNGRHAQTSARHPCRCRIEAGGRLKVPAAEFAKYDLTRRSAKNHRTLTPGGSVGQLIQYQPQCGRQVDRSARCRALPGQAGLVEAAAVGLEENLRGRMLA